MGLAASVALVVDEGPALVDVVKGGATQFRHRGFSPRVQAEGLFQFLRRPDQQVVKDVVVALPGLLPHHPRLFQQVTDVRAAQDGMVRIKMNQQPFPKPGRIVVAHL